MPKKPVNIKISPEANKKLNELRDENRHFNLSTEVEALIGRIHADKVKEGKIKPAN